MTYLTTAEVAAELRMSEDYVARQCAAGRLAATKLGNQWRITDAALAAFMSAGKVEPTRIRQSARQRRRSA